MKIEASQLIVSVIAFLAMLSITIIWRWLLSKKRRVSVGNKLPNHMMYFKQLQTDKPIEIGKEGALDKIKDADPKSAVAKRHLLDMSTWKQASFIPPPHTPYGIKSTLPQGSSFYKVVQNTSLEPQKADEETRKYPTSKPQMNIEVFTKAQKEAEDYYVRTKKEDKERKQKEREEKEKAKKEAEEKAKEKAEAAETATAAPKKLGLAGGMLLKKDTPPGEKKEGANMTLTLNKPA